MKNIKEKRETSKEMNKLVEKYAHNRNLKKEHYIIKDIYIKLAILVSNEYFGDNEFK